MHGRNERAALTLSQWLNERTDSERATLARLWSLPMNKQWTPAALAAAMLRPDAVDRVLASLGPRERAALSEIQQEGGTIPAAKLEREFGGVRHHADYPNPRAYLLALEQPPTPTERLYTLALVQVLYDGWQRAYTIPADLLALLPPVPQRDRSLHVTPAVEPQKIYNGEARFIEQNLITMIGVAQDGQLEVIPTGGLNKASLLRLARQWDEKANLKGISREEHWPYIQFLRRIAEGAGLLRVGADAHLRPTRDALDWMRQPTLTRVRRLLDSWLATDWDELASFSGLKFQRDYNRDLSMARRAILQLVSSLPTGQWIAFDDFVASVQQVEPDFARPDGNYDSWGIVSYTRQPLDGFENWNAVEGEQLRAIVGGTLNWLGLTDLGMNGDQPVSFRINPFGTALLKNGPMPEEAPVEPLVVLPNFEVVVQPYASLFARFQIGRIAERTAGGYASDNAVAMYKLTKRSIQSACEHGITLDEMLTFLREQGKSEPPQNVVATLCEWADQHGQVSLRSTVLLEAEEPALLEQIKRDKRVKLPQVEPLTETTWLVREGDASALAERLRKAGYGLTGDGDVAQAPLREHDLTVLFTALEFYNRACAALGIEGDVSGAMYQRVARLLSEKQLNRAYQTSHAALKRLREKLE